MLVMIVITIEWCEHEKPKRCKQIGGKFQLGAIQAQPENGKFLDELLNVLSI
jgi:hypothetical protein